MVMTYGQIAALCGNARAARIVGGIAHFGPTDLPWQRVVNRQGGLATGYHGGKEAHKKDLEADGVTLQCREDNYYVDIDTYLWHP